MMDWRGPWPRCVAVAWQETSQLGLVSHITSISASPSELLLAH